MSCLQCYYCKETKKDLHSFLKHVKSERKLPYKCSLNTCKSKIFGNPETFRCHIKKHLARQKDVSEMIPEVEDSCEFEINTPNSESLSKATNSIENLRNDFLRVFLPMYSSDNIARKESIERTRSLCDHFKKALDLIFEVVKDLPDNAKTLELIDDLKASIDIRSEYMLIKELEKSNLYVRSQFVEFARKQESVRTKENEIGIKNLIYGVSVFPLQPAFYKLFNETDILSHIIQYMDEVKNSSILKNYIHCKLICLY